MFFATRWNTRKLKIKTVLGTIAEDATWYFFVIFTAHVVFVFTLNLGRVSATILFSRQLLMSLSSKQSNFFRLCKFFLIRVEHKNSYPLLFCRAQGHHGVSLDLAYALSYNGQLPVLGTSP